MCEDIQTAYERLVTNGYDIPFVPNTTKNRIGPSHVLDKSTVLDRVGKPVFPKKF